MDTELITIAEQLLRDRYIPMRHVVASALRARGGQVFTGLHIGGAVARVSLCAEVVALSQAIISGRADLDIIVALHHTSSAGSGSGSQIVSPCGMCRELLNDYDPDLRVIVPDGRGELTTIPINELLPHKFTRLWPETSPR